MEKRILIAALLSALVMAVYSSMMGPTHRQARPTAQLVAQEHAVGSVAEPVIRSAEASYEIARLSGTEGVGYINNRRIQFEIGKETVSIRAGVLKEHRDLQTGELLVFGGESPIAAFEIDGSRLQGRLVESGERQAVWSAKDSHGRVYDVAAVLDSDKPLLHIKIESSIQSDFSSIPGSIAILSTWNKADDLGGSHNRLEAIIRTVKNGPFQREYVKYYDPQKKVKSVPRGTRSVVLADRFFCQSIKLIGEPGSMSAVPSPEGTIGIRTELPLVSHGDVVSGEFDLYLGTRQHHELKRAGFVEAMPIGILGRIGLVLLFIMNGIAGVVGNYGLAILIFSVGIACALAPFTLMGMRSMKKMQQLKPEMDRIMAKQKTNPQKANTEMMALYKEHKVSPLSGCLPMLLQFPVLIALFQSISHFVELRGEGFLWIQDLSLPDRIMKLPFTLPILGEYLNLLPVIMTLAMVVQMKVSRSQMSGAADNPMSRAMGGPMMSIIFGFMFYQFPAGLVLYWLTNSIMTLVWHRLAAKS